MKANYTIRTLKKSGCLLHYWIRKGKSDFWLVFLHGTGADSTMFGHQYDALGDKYNIITCDIRSHGLSQPTDEPFTIELAISDVLAIMKQEKCAKAIFIGHCMGGNISQE